RSFSHGYSSPFGNVRSTRTGYSPPSNVDPRERGPVTQLVLKRSSVGLALLTLTLFVGAERDVRADEGPPTTAKPEDSATPPIEEVHVTGKREAPTARSMNRSDIRLSAGSFGDPFRAIDTSPGLVPTLSGIPYV